ncbi:MAG: hypothetical protein GY857_05990 [Desulfobacula sp.]|nr:hypothetical protein [Desulfobacula sp.]
MKKKFSISLIIMASFLYGTIFFISQRHETSFFDEIVIQLTRMTTNMNKSQEVQFTKTILAVIINNEHPPSDWNRFIAHNPKYDNKELFYYYKIWSLKTNLNIADINASYPIYSASSEQSIFINMRYGKDKPVVRFPFYKDNKENLMIGLFFPINEKPLNADLNNDNQINHKDVVIARKKG